MQLSRLCFGTSNVYIYTILESIFHLVSSLNNHIEELVPIGGLEATEAHGEALDLF